MDEHNQGSFIKHFSDIEDPRIDRHKRYPLIEILFLVLCGSICGAEGWRDYVLFGNSKLSYLRQYFPFENGVPSKSTLSLVFSMLKPDTMKKCFLDWVQSIQEVVEGVIAIDGKKLRHSFDKASDKSAIHMRSGRNPG